MNIRFELFEIQLFHLLSICIALPGNFFFIQTD
jgi:hypothetical protein